MPTSNSYAEDGYDLWLRYRLSTGESVRDTYRSLITHVSVQSGSATLTAAETELFRGLQGLLGVDFRRDDRDRTGGMLVVGTTANPAIASLDLQAAAAAGAEGYVIQTVQHHGRRVIAIAANGDIGVLYGVFHFLRVLQTWSPIEKLDVVSAPKVRFRLLNHWDNLDRTVERGYAGSSLWDWHKLPDYIDRRYVDYARANASVGINGTVLTNVNANAISLTREYVMKAAALADVFRPYGIRVYLTARFSAPMDIGGLPTADPLDAAVRFWWAEKASEIYRYIPDFGGFLVKANSEGQPGPQDYGRSHADGANMLAEALATHGGIVMWRAFVYDHEVPDDRAKQAYNEFTPLDGTFRDNVMVQVKNGPIDFQPREPFHPLFGAMPATPLMMELQITQEYLGFATHLAYLAPLYKEVLDSDTYAMGPGSFVSGVLDGTLHGNRLTGIAGVANIGTDRNWCGSHFAQANWFAFGRLAWDHSLTATAIAAEWLRMTFSNDDDFVEPAMGIMMRSREAVVNYMTPLGLHHLMAAGHHYGPGPWVDSGRADWTSVYYHRADSVGIGFDRTATGSNAVAQYFPAVRARFASRDSVPSALLLWFHHVRWGELMPAGLTLWEELVHAYYGGVESVRSMQHDWLALRGLIDTERYEQVRAFLAIQEKEARWWRDACVLYFQSHSQMPIPAGLEAPAHSLNYYESIRHPYAPGI